MFLDIKKHLDYLDSVSTGYSPPITSETAALARQAWQQLWESSGCVIPVPAACTGPDGQISYVWDNEEHHLELDILPNGAAEWFYRNRQTMYWWGDLCTVGEPLSPGVIEKIGYFLPKKRAM